MQGHEEKKHRCSKRVEIHICKKKSIPEDLPPKKKTMGTWVMHLTGLSALIWFLVRVIPKPSRASYPCQKAAAPMALSFLAFVGSWLGMTFSIKKGIQFISQYKLVTGVCCLGIGAIAGLASLSFIATETEAFTDYIALNSTVPFAPPEGPNTPVGKGRGIHPGRVVWYWDADATVKKPAFESYWWSRENNDQEVIDNMIETSIQYLTGESTSTAAWKAIFRFFNKNYGKGKVGYVPGEIVVIKVNDNTARESRDPCEDGAGKNDNGKDPYKACSSTNASPATVLGLVTQLVEYAGVPEHNIVVAEPSRYLIQPIIDQVNEVYPGVRFVDDFGGDGVEEDKWVDEVTFSVGGHGMVGGRIARSHRDADYIINLAIIKGHGAAGVTMHGKNLFGSVSKREHDLIKSYLHGYGSYTPIVDLMTHRDLGKKTLLFFLDATYANGGSDGNPVKWQMAPFNNDWPNSIFVSLDNVAIESVGWDFFKANFNRGGSFVNSDNYLHEAAEIATPPSGTKYRQNGPGTPWSSMGVHEHWNNDMDMQYSRNLGQAEGIELIKAHDSLKVHLKDVADKMDSDEQVLTTSNQPYDITIKNLQGRVLTQFTTTNPNDISYNGLPKGLHIMQVKSAGKVVLQKKILVK